MQSTPTLTDNSRADPLQDWVRRISDEEMPIFGHTVQGVIEVAEDDNAPAAELARVVLQDASMTARVLKLANAAFYNPRENISTVSRAVIVLGFNPVRNMCLSIALVDSFVKGTHKDRLTAELARSVHAAVQARALAVERYDKSPEEVFIATLLYHLGEMAFWCFSGEVGEELNTLMEQPGYTREMAEEEVLGFRLHNLTSSLAREWHLNKLLSTALQHPEDAGSRGKLITLSHRLANVAERGWSDPEVDEIVRDMARLADIPTEDMRGKLHHNAREASRIAGIYGAGAAARAIPLPGGRTPKMDEELEQEKREQHPEPNGMLQLKILRELSMMLDDKPNFNLIMELVLEGIYRGIGMDRTLFALLTPDRKGIKAKYMLGSGRGDLRGRFQFLKTPQEPNIFFQVVERQVSAWVDITRKPEFLRLIPHEVNRAVGKAPFFVTPIIVSGRSIGLFYADRALSGRPLDEDSYESFKHFTQQANMGLTYVAKRHN